MKRVERVEKLFLKPFFTFKKLNVIYKKDIYISVDFLKLTPSVSSDCIHKLVKKSLGRNINYSFDWMTLIFDVVTLDVVANGLQQMRFAKASMTVDKEWIVGFTRGFSNGECSCQGKSIRWPCYKFVENVVWMQGSGRSAH